VLYPAITSRNTAAPTGPGFARAWRRGPHGSPDGDAESLRHVPSSLPFVEKVARPIIVYAFLVLCFRLTGKRLRAQLNPFDFVMLLILSNTVQNAIIGNDNSVAGGVIAAATLLLFNSFVVHRLVRHQRLEKAVEGSDENLIENGKIVTRTLERDGISKYELTVAAHKQGFDSLRDVERAVLAPGGAPFFFRHTPTTDESRQNELLARLDRIEKRLERLA